MTECGRECQLLVMDFCLKHARNSDYIYRLYTCTCLVLDMYALQ